MNYCLFIYSDNQKGEIKWINQKTSTNEQKWIMDYLEEMLVLWHTGWTPKGW